MSVSVFRLLLTFFNEDTCGNIYGPLDNPQYSPPSKDHWLEHICKDPFHNKVLFITGSRTCYLWGPLFSLLYLLSIPTKKKKDKSKGKANISLRHSHFTYGERPSFTKKMSQEDYTDTKHSQRSEMDFFVLLLVSHQYWT